MKKSELKALIKEQATNKVSEVETSPEGSFSPSILKHKVLKRLKAILKAEIKQVYKEDAYEYLETLEDAREFSDIDSLLQEMGYDTEQIYVFLEKL
jgi:hypothetical protein